MVYTGPASNGGSETYSNTAAAGSSVISVPFVTNYSPYVNNSNGASGGEQLATLQPSSIKRTYPPASSSPAPNATTCSEDKKLKLDTEEESEK